MWLKYADHEIVFDRSLPDAVQFERPAFGQRYWGKDGELYLTAHCCQKFRPWGVYFSDDTSDNWPAWCVNWQHRLDELTHKHKIVLDERNILIIRDARALEEFSWEYTVLDPQLAARHAFTPCPGVAFGELGTVPAVCPGTYIDWRRVASRYDGFIVSPYQDGASLKTINGWYRYWPWGVGCVWKKSAILNIRLLEINPDIVFARPDPEHFFRTPPSVAAKLDSLEATQ